MTKRRGNLKIVLASFEGQGTLRLVHTGQNGKRTLGTFSHSLVDKVAFKGAAVTWLAQAHPKLDVSRGAS